MNPLVSIIVTVYQKEGYLEDTLQTVVSTSYPNKEVIVVDDCSTDGGPDIIARFCARHPFVKSIRHQENRGLSAARNTGLEAASGDYVQFWDADDKLDPTGLQRIVTEMAEDGSDIGTGIAFRGGAPLGRYRGAMRSVRSTTYAETPSAGHNDSTCFKVYRRGFLLDNDLFFVPGLYMQDIELNLRAMPLAKRITMTPYCLGEYTYSDTSGSKSYSQGRYEASLEIDKRTRSFYAGHGLSQFETLRQARMVNSVYAYFLKHALSQVTSNYRIPGGHSNYIDGPDKAWRYIDSFREAAHGLTEGMKLVFKKNPGPALAFVGLIEGAIDQVLPLLHGKLPDESFPKFFPKTGILEAEQIATAAARLAPPSPELAWAPAC